MLYCILLKLLKKNIVVGPLTHYQSSFSISSSITLKGYIYILSKVNTHCNTLMAVSSHAGGLPRHWEQLGFSVMPKQNHQPDQWTSGTTTVIPMYFLYFIFHYRSFITIPVITPSPGNFSMTLNPDHHPPAQPAISWLSLFCHI